MDSAADRSTEVSAARTEFSVLLERINALKPMVRDLARETEKNRRVSARSMEMLRKAEIDKILKPRAFGGFEYGFEEAMRLGFELGRVCGSTGWCASLTMAYPWILSHYTLRAQQEVWNDNPEAMFCSASPDPRNQAEYVPGGIRFSGAWHYGSNCDNSQWAMLTQFMPNKRGGIDKVWALLPTSEAIIDQDTWFTSGLQGTGSKTLRIEKPVFVPDYRLTTFADVDDGNTPGTRIPDNIMGRFAFMTFSTGMLAAPILGMAQGALDVFIKMSQTKVRMARPGVTESVANSPLVQSKVAMTSSIIESAFTMLLSSTRDAEAKVRRGEALSVDERVALRRNQGFSGRQAVAVVNDLFSQEGASSSSLAAPLQRFWRDVNTGAQHITLNWESISTMYGQRVFGLEPVGAY